MSQRRAIVSMSIVMGIAAMHGTLVDGAEKSIPGIGPTGELVKLHEGFKFSEGPAADREGNFFFSDIFAQKIHKVDLEGKLSVFVDKTDFSNGLMWDGKGGLVACAPKYQVSVYSADGKNRRALAETYEGKRFNAPNDLVIDQAGGVYFSDNKYSLDGRVPQGVEAVYYIAPDGNVSRVLSDAKTPNGIILAPDEKTLYVVQTEHTQVRAYPVTAPGKVESGRVFCTLKLGDGKSIGFGDGCTIDTKGNLYVATLLGIQVFDPAGKPLGIIPLPVKPTNVTFGGKNRRTLFITTGAAVYSAPMTAQGHVFPAGRK